MTFRCPQCNKIRDNDDFFLDGYDLPVCKICFKQNNEWGENMFQKEFRYNEAYKDVDNLQ